MTIRSILAAATLAFAGTAHANLVADGGFEADSSGNYAAADYPFPLGPSTFGPWTVDAGFVYVDGFAVQAHSGMNSLDLTPGLFASNVSQTIATAPGKVYQLQFFAAAHSANTFFVDWNGAPVAGSPTSLPDTIPVAASDFTGDYRAYSFLVTAVGSASTLAFGGTDPDTPGVGPNTIEVDDVSLTAVPEPSSWALTILGAALLGGVVRGASRRRQVGSRAGARSA